MAVQAHVRHPLAAAGLDIRPYVLEKRAQANAWVSLFAPAEGSPAALFSAMRYSLLAPGKRFRPVLAIAVCEALGGCPDAVAPMAVAVEWVHTYSLIHDDLPCMDDDDMRRGRPTNHRIYGEAVALLAGDALLAEAFAIASEPARGQMLTPESRLAFVQTLAAAAGAGGMVGGQVLDLSAQGQCRAVEHLECLHRLKTGALIEAAALAGAYAAGAPKSDEHAVSSYARHLGLAFQIADDILDVQGSAALLGKSTGSDARLGKTTYVSLLGVDGAEAAALREAHLACEAIESFGERAQHLACLAYYVVERQE